MQYVLQDPLNSTYLTGSISYGTPMFTRNAGIAVRFDSLHDIAILRTTYPDLKRLIPRPVDKLTICFEQSDTDDFLGTYSGRHVHVLNPSPDEIYMPDIAHALSNICRFNGHTIFFYSVAQHSILTMQLAADYTGKCSGPRLRLLALMHDATEAYICDIPRPLKQYIPEYHMIEKNVMNAIYGFLSISGPTLEEKKLLRKFDNEALFMESRQLMMGSDKWTLEPTDKHVDIKYHKPSEVQELFLNFVSLNLSDMTNKDYFKEHPVV